MTMSQSDVPTLEVTQNTEEKTVSAVESAPEAPKKKRGKTPEERLTNLDLTGKSATFDDFAAKFGIENAIAMTRCGLHRIDRPETDDPFMDCINVAISYDCLTVYYGHDGFTSDPSAVQEWVREHFPLDKYSDGDDAMPKVFKKTFQSYLGL